LDPVLHIVHLLSSESLPRKTVETAVEIYRDKGSWQAVEYLTAQGRMERAKAVDTVNIIDREFTRTNRERLYLRLVITVVIFILMLLSGWAALQSGRINAVLVVNLILFVFLLISLVRLFAKNKFVAHPLTGTETGPRQTGPGRSV
jgi:hypothetical protein